MKNNRIQSVQAEERIESERKRKRKVFFYVPFRLGCEYCTNPSDTYRVLLIVDARLHRVSVGCLVYSSSVSSSAYIEGTLRSGLYDVCFRCHIHFDDDFHAQQERTKEKNNNSFYYVN